MAKPLPHALSARIHQRLWDACARYRRLSSLDGPLGGGAGDSPGADGLTPVALGADAQAFLDSAALQLPGRGYQSGGPAVALRLEASRVSLPAEAGTADLLSLLPPDLAREYADPRQLLKPREQRESARKHFAADPHEYSALVARLQSIGQLSFTTRPACVNGLFAVPKGDKQRLILDARPLNAMCREPPSVSLPSPEHLALLEVPKGTRLHIGKVDIDNFYHRLRMPAAWHRYFALPAIRAGDIGLAGYGPEELVHPCLTTLPMGWSHSVYLAQKLHEHLLFSNPELHLRASDAINAAGPGTVDRLRFGAYIDDLMLFDTDPHRLRAVQEAYCSMMEGRGLSPKRDKTVYPDPGGPPQRTECLGTLVDAADLVVGVAPAKLASLVAHTQAFIGRKQATGKELSELVGRWTWAMLAARPSLSIFSNVYRFILITRERRFDLWPSVVRELKLVSQLAPLLSVSIRGGQWWPRAIATDASALGQGVVMRAIGEADLTPFLSEAFPNGPNGGPAEQCRAWVTRSKWGTIVSKRWARPEHINCLEARAVLTAFRWALSYPKARGRRLCILSDSRVAIGAIRKGRSSSFGLLVVLRAVAALSLASGCQLRLYWLPTDINPADGPSRSPRGGGRGPGLPFA